MTRLSAFIESADILGPGLPDWLHTADVFAGRARYAHAPTESLPPAGLPSVERRRTGPVVKLALAAGYEAVAASGRDAATLTTAFSSSGDDGHNCNTICETLAGDDRKLSPTRFRNSVHNAPVGHRSIATYVMASLNVLCAYDDSFVANLPDGLHQVAIDAMSAPVIAHDGDCPEPLNAVRLAPDPFAVALASAPETGSHTLARTDVTLTDASLMALAQSGLETLWHGNAAVHALPPLEALAVWRAGRVVFEYLYETHVQIDATFDTS